MNLPQKSEVRHISSEIRKTEQQLKKVTDSVKDDDKRIRRAISNLIDRRVMEILDRTDVEELNRSGERIRVNALKKEGYQFIGQLVHLSYSKLERMDGIGDQSASLIRRKVKEMYASLKEETVLRIREDDAGDRELVQALCIRIRNDEVRREADVYYHKHHDRIRSSLKDVSVLSGMFRRLFSTRTEKERAAAAFRVLEELYRGTWRKEADRLIQLHRTVNGTETEACLADFRRNATVYYALLSSYDPRSTEGDTYGLSDELIEEIDAVQLNTERLRAVLRPYQAFGVKYILHQKRVLLGDEMGLGKTVEAIAVMAHLAAEGGKYFLVVCPASVIVNWEREVRKFSGLDCTMIRGNDAHGLEVWIDHGGVGITTYETISRFTLPLDLRLDLLTADEAHYVKNPAALRTKAMQSLTLHADRILFMTGTPLENRVDEMSLLISMISPETGKAVRDYDSITTAPKYRRLLAPVYLRRRREDVLGELPQKEEIENWVEMTEDDRLRYRKAVLAESFQDMRRVSWQWDEPEASGKAMRLLEICEEAHVIGRKVIIFSFFRDTLDRVSTLLGDLCTEQINGSVTPAKRQEIIDRFSQDDSCSVLPAQVQAGGTGLNIQAASIVVFCEPQLKPSAENQAIARVYRMGQTQKVVVHHLLSVGSADERIMDLLTDKQELFDRFADDSLIGTESLKMTESAWIRNTVAEERKRWTEENQS